MPQRLASIFPRMHPNCLVEIFLESLPHSLNRWCATWVHRIAFVVKAFIAKAHYVLIHCALSFMCACMRHCFFGVECFFHTMEKGQGLGVFSCHVSFHRKTRVV